jgi:hypothetical protein
MNLEEAKRREEIYNKAAIRQEELVELINNATDNRAKKLLIKEFNSYFSITGASW